MDKARKTIQAVLNTCTKVECGVPMPDDIVQNGENYFGYELQSSYSSSDFNKYYTMQISLVGRIVRKYNPTENTIEKVDEALEEILGKLKTLNFKYSTQDVTLDNEIRKIVVSGYVIYNEMNDEFIV